MTGEKDQLCDLIMGRGPPVTFGDNSKGRVIGKGNLMYNRIKIRDVSLVSNLKHNLLSISQLSEHGYTVSFTSSGCEIKDSTTNELKLKGSRKGGLYFVDWNSGETGTCLVATSSVPNADYINWLWHKRLGHLNFKIIRHLVKHGLVEGVPESKFKKEGLCQACQLGKQARESFKSRPISASSERILELLHMDLFGPVKPPTIGLRKFTLVVVDDYSRYTWVRLMKTKDEVNTILSELILLLQNEKGVTVKRIRSDNGTEFCNGFLMDFCAEIGIGHERSTPRTPQQNGLAERRNRTIKEAARTMMAESELDKRLWGEAVVTACYVQNRL